MSSVDDIRALFPGRSFGSACTDTDIRIAEEILGEPLPSVLRELYLAFDGFRGSTDAYFFWSLFGPEGMVEMNRFYRGDDIFPQELVTQCLFFGDNGCGQQWGFKRDLSDTIIKWDAEWGADFEIAGKNPFDAWQAEKRFYDSLADND